MAKPDIFWYRWDVEQWRSSETNLRLTSAGRGIYRELIDYCWMHGSIPAEVPTLTTISKATQREFSAVWPIINGCFTEVEGRLHHWKVDAERPSLVARIKQAREAGASGGRSKAHAVANAVAHARPHAVAEVVPNALAESKPALKRSLALALATSNHNISPPPPIAEKLPELAADEMDPQQQIHDAIEAVAKFWPVIGNKTYAQSAWERASATFVGGVDGWCRSIVQTALRHASAHDRIREQNPRHFVPTLERWVSDGDYTSPPPRPVEKKKMFADPEED